jgi:hypothetical protein
MDLTTGRLAGVGLNAYPIPEPAGGGPAYVLLMLEDWREWPVLKQWQASLTPGEARALAVTLTSCAVACVGPEDLDVDPPVDDPW